jgi:hypothetical protein
MSNELTILMETAKNLALLLNTLEMRSAASLQEQQQATQALQQAVASLRSDVQQLIHTASGQVAQSAKQGVDAALSSGTAKYNQETATMTTTLGGSVRTFVETLNVALMKVLRQVWTSFAAVAGAIILLIGGGGLLLWFQAHAYDDARARTASAQVDAETAEAYAQAGMTSCGGRPCMKLDTKSPRWGNKGEYVLLDLTARAESSPAKN